MLSLLYDYSPGKESSACEDEQKFLSHVPLFCQFVGEVLNFVAAVCPTTSSAKQKQIMSTRMTMGMGLSQNGFLRDFLQHVV